MIKTVFILITTSIFSITSFASDVDPVVCLSNDALPKHCKEGDILVVRPKEVATSCDFTQEIVRLKPAKDKVEFLCRYTGNILKIKPNTSRPPKQMAPQPLPPIQRNRRKSSFGSMPFFN